LVDRPPYGASLLELQAWLDTFTDSMAMKITPRFVSAQSVSHEAFTTDEASNEAVYTLQFLTLYQLFREAIHVADGELLMILYKPALAVFDRFHRTKYRSVSPSPIQIF